MSEITTMGDAAYSVLCKLDPYAMQRKDPAKFQKWMDRQDAKTKGNVYLALGRAWGIREEQHEERTNG